MEINLRELPVLAVDCQATGGRPGKGFLLEIGWLRITVDEFLDPELFRLRTRSFLVKRIKGQIIPWRVTRLTGIQPDELEAGLPEKDIWDQILITANKVMKSSGMKHCPMVIHFSRYEEPFIRYLQDKYGKDKEFPFTIICTHQIISRLFPGLPRKGLRAVAGYFGLSLPDFRRCQEHVVATAYIWGHLVGLLEKECDIHTFNDLKDWMRSGSYCENLRKTRREYPMEEKYLEDLPDLPGIYRMYRANGDILYIGKARSLKKRVSSYFRGKGQHAEHILEMLSQARLLTTTPTSTALEAALRESDEIKYYSPPYNRSLKDDGRQMVYFSTDLKKVSPKPGPSHSLGPFPHTRLIAPLGHIMDILNEKNKKITIESLENILNAAPEYCPDPFCFKEGLDYLKEEFFKDKTSDVVLADLKRLGVLFWKEKMAARKESDKNRAEEYEEENISDHSPEQEPHPLGWTPERVYAVLKSIIRIGIFYIRRAHWLCRLSEASIVWEVKEEDSCLLSIEGGTFPTVVSFVKEKGIPLPKGYKKNRLARQKCFDIDTYDRMRVLTTEIRRIISEDRKVELRFSPRILLRTEQIRAMLQWV